MAAILFPVFAQAKAAAKKTTALSNLKEEALAFQIYAGDSDDVPALLLTSRKNAAGEYDGTNTWVDLLQPYQKNYDLGFDPVSPYQKRTDYHYFSDYWFSLGALPKASAISNGAFNNYLTREKEWFQRYGKVNQKYDGILGEGVEQNDTWWGSGWSWTDNANSNPGSSFTTVNSPANYALAFSSNNFDGFHGVYGTQVGFGFCGGWVGYDYSYEGFQPRHTGGRNDCVVSDNGTSDPADRATQYGVGSAIVAFADGHAKSLKASELVKDDGNGNLKYFSPDAN